jgi:MFS transporter, DHA2 family, multidrug resistance protein
VTTMLARNQQKHINVLGGHVTPYDPTSQSMLAQMTAALQARGADLVTATRQAQAAVWGMVQQQAAMMAYRDVFILLAAMFLLLIPLVLLMKRPSHQTGGAAMMH